MDYAFERGQFFDTAEMYSIPANETLQEYRAYYRELVEEIRKKRRYWLQNCRA
jgi:aryl-alcohol dehydrogenase-like predicted oxidoreductase